MSDWWEHPPGPIGWLSMAQEAWSGDGEPEDVSQEIGEGEKIYRCTECGYQPISEEAEICPGCGDIF